MLIQSIARGTVPLASDAVRALAWFDPREVEDALATVVSRLPGNAMAELAAFTIMSARSRIDLCASSRLPNPEAGP